MASRLALVILLAALAGCGRRAERAWFDAPLPEGPPRAQAPLLIPAACQVQWAPSDFPREVAPETWIATNVTFTNLSETVWPDNAMGDPTLLSGMYAVRLAHAWYPAAQKKRAHGNARINLDKPLAPHASATLLVNVLTPEQPGDYELVFELLQEGVLWFSDTGAEGLVIPVRVRPRAASVPPPQAAAPPR
jgi:hypothetical protein